MKKLKYILLLLVATLALASCESFMEEVDTEDVSKNPIKEINDSSLECF